VSAPNDYYQAISGEIFRQTANYMHGKPYDVRFFYEEGENGDTEGWWGTPDMIVKVFSPTNTSEEYVRTFDLYLKAGRREYWVVALKSKNVQVFVPQNGTYILGRPTILPPRFLQRPRKGFRLP
jgi:Uma2 family endonuclease